MQEAPIIVVAGASGYIGKAILPRLLEKFPAAQIIALSRGAQKQQGDSRISWKACDLFSLKELEEAMPPRCDLALYLVHSMGPTAKLDQGSFADYDLILADNFARTVKKLQLKQLIYLGGLIPATCHLSLHLQSRLEVEETFREHQLPTTVFRAGLILGESGSSFQILLKLVKRLPVMICPKWTQTLTTPVDLDTVLSCITSAALQDTHTDKIYDLAGCPPLTYLQMMSETALHLGLQRRFFAVPFFSATLSRLWVCLITQTPKNLVYPLVGSLKHPLLPRADHLFPTNVPYKNYRELLIHASCKTQKSRPFFRFRVERKTVRSVQRFLLPVERDALWVKEQYLEWLPRFFHPLVKVIVEEGVVKFALFSARWVLLELHFSQERSHPDRQLLYIIKGMLVAKENRGRLEFRVALHRKYILAAIHDYAPALPWYLYIFTQAQVHALVMKSFGHFLWSHKKSQKSSA